MFVFFYDALSVPCSLVITCWTRADLLALVRDVFLSFCHFPIFAFFFTLKYEHDEWGGGDSDKK